jgi:hypothetical protein
MFTRFANPHRLESAVQTVSRKEINNEDDETNVDLDVDSETVIKLENLLKRTLGDPPLDADAGGERKKRRKTSEQNGENLDTAEEPPAVGEPSPPLVACLRV